MYRYDEFDQALVDQRVTQFRGQVARRLTGEVAEDEFKPLRLMNGLYLQLHAYMLRVAIPYGTLDARQMRALADIARRYDRGYGHFTTRQNLQYNWIKLEETPDLLADLAEVQMHAIQTSGNCIRNVTADHYAGVAADEIEDPRIYSEIVRQWSTLHPEFSFLPRKFKIAVTGAARAAAQPERRDRLRGLGRRWAGAHAGHRQDHPRVPAAGAPAELSRGDLARLQPTRPARQHL
jgi:sulfite reductase (NADPH) hemoprotein beta-component